MKRPTPHPGQHRALLALVSVLAIIFSTSTSTAHVAPVDMPQTPASRAADPRLGLDGQVVYYIYRLSLREPRLTSGNDVVGLRLASDPTLRRKGRPLQHFGGLEVYDMRARQWAPELGAFLSLDEYRFHDARSTLWGWPRQNPIRYRDPSGHVEDGSPMLEQTSETWGQWAFQNPEAAAPIQAAAIGVRSLP